MKLKTIKALKISVIAALVATILVFATLSVCAYFSTRVYVYTENGQEVAQVGMNLRLLFGELDSSRVAQGADLKIPRYEVENGYVVYYDGVDHTAETNGTDQRTKYDPTAPWGSAQNPYVISETRHLQNLSALQNVGYFDLLYIANNFANGEYQEGRASIPYFLICNVDGTPITIDGSELDSAIKPIGNAEHPFIGVLGGAFKTQTTTGTGDTATTTQHTTTVAGKTSSVSAIHGFKIQTNTNQNDVGLFGYVGFMGEEPKGDDVEDENFQFAGVFSSIQNVLISDVSVTVNNPTLPEEISELFAPFWSTFFGTDTAGKPLHRYSYTDKSNADTLPHETHHIGIFAGHVSYALIDNINVYYSNDNTYAIDLTHVLDKDGNTLSGDNRNNYYSASGILGMMYNMNCTIENQTNGNCVVKMGTGTSADEVAGGGSGTGTGGGALSGNGRGYVTAAEIFSDFNNVAVKEDANNELLWKYKYKNGDKVVEVDGAILIYKKGNAYTLADGKTAATVNGTTSVSATVNGAVKTWEKFFIRETLEDEDQVFQYMTPGGLELLSYEVMGNKYHNQIMWTFSAGGNGVWHYGIRVLWDGSKYTLEDGKTVVTFDKTNNQITDGTNVWKNFFISDTTEDASMPHYMYDPATGENLTVSRFERKPMTLIEAVNEKGENLCVEWISTFLGRETKTGLYYFYDGVFTFGLSSAEDTVRDTWKNNDIPDLYLGPDDPDEWKVNPQRGNQAVLAFLSAVTDNATLDAAIADGKQLYISAKPVTTNQDLLLMMSLVNGSTNTLNATTRELDDETGASLYQSYAGGEYTQVPEQPYYNWSTGKLQYRPMMELGELKDLWDEDTGKFGEYEVLNVGRTSESVTLTELQKLYNINGKKVTTGSNGATKYYYFDSQGIPVTDPAGAATIPVYEVYDKGYIFYVITSKYGTDYLYMYYQAPNGDLKEVAIREEGYGWNGKTDINENYIRNNVLNAGTIDGNGFYSGPLNNVGDVSNVPIVDCSNTTTQYFFGGTTKAVVNGTKVAKQTGSQNYYIYDAATQKYMSYNGSTVSDSAAGFTGDMLTRYPSYKFADSSANKFLQLVVKETTRTINITIFGITFYSFDIVIGSEYHLETGADSTGAEGILVFNDDGSCQLQYWIDNYSQFVSYNYEGASSSSNKFVGANAGKQLYVYVVEGVLDMNWGVNTFVPDTLDGSNGIVLSGGEYVLWPQTTLKQDGTYTNNGQSLVTGSTENATNIKTTDPVYIVKKLSDMRWGTAEGIMLGQANGYGLDKKFQMADQSAFGNILNLDRWGLGTLPSGTSSIMVAPVGSNGVEATIPKGCVAFRVESGGTQTIRIIVAVPATDKYVGSGGTESGFNLDLDKDYYIGVWQVEAAGESLSATFNKSTAVEKFELPRSYTFDFDDTPTSVNGLATKPYTLVAYDADGDGTIEESEHYRTYLNGDCFLVAYEFTINGGTSGGVFIIGSVHGDNNTTSDLDVPMEIVHFSVSGTASAGRDGVTGNQLGAIDFVYDDTANTIVTIDKQGANTGISNGATEYYSNYYSSQSMLYSDNEAQVESKFIRLDNAKLYIRRRVIDTGTTVTVNNATVKVYQTTLSYKIESTIADAFRIKQYAINSDAVDKRTN